VRHSKKQHDCLNILFGDVLVAAQQGKMLLDDHEPANRDVAKFGSYLDALFHQDHLGAIFYESRKPQYEKMEYRNYNNVGRIHSKGSKQQIDF